MKRILLILLLILAAIYLSIPQRRDQEGNGLEGEK